MQFIQPNPIAGVALVSSTRPEDDYPAWSAITTYATAGRVISPVTHRVYQSVQDANTNHDPATDANGEWWVDIGPTNRWAMFDVSVGTVTSNADELTVVIDPGLISALALLDIEGSSVRVSMASESGTVYDQTFDIADDTELIDWWDYFFGPIHPATSLMVTDLPPFHAGRLTVTISNPGNTAACGTLVAGDLVYVGDVEYGARVGITDYSRKETDQYGSTSVTERGYAKRFEPSVRIRNTALDYITKRFAGIRAQPVVWIGVQQYESTIIYGWLRDWGINITYPNESQASLTIEGLT